MALGELEKDKGAFALFQAGEAARRIGAYSRAERFFRSSSEQARSAGDFATVAWAFWGLATLRRLGGQFDAALEFYRLAAECAVDTANADCFAWARAGEAEIIRHRRKHRDALKHHEELLQVFQKNGDAVGELWALQGVGQILLVNAARGADDFFLRAEDAAREIGDLRAVGFSRRALAISARRKGDVERAKVLLTEAEHLFESLEYQVGLGFTLREQAHCEIIAGDLNQAGHLIRKALTRFGGFTLGRAWALATSAQIEKESGVPNQATLIESAKIFRALGVEFDAAEPQVKRPRGFSRGGRR